jgi:hypothetical protein
VAAYNISELERAMGADDAEVNVHQAAVHSLHNDKDNTVNLKSTERRHFRLLFSIYNTFKAPNIRQDKN